MKKILYLNVHSEAVVLSCLKHFKCYTISHSSSSPWHTNNERSSEAFLFYLDVQIHAHNYVVLLDTLLVRT